MGKLSISLSLIFAKISEFHMWDKFHTREIYLQGKQYCAYENICKLDCIVENIFFSWDVIIRIQADARLILDTNCNFAQFHCELRYYEYT